MTSTTSQTPPSLAPDNYGIPAARSRNAAPTFAVTAYDLTTSEVVPAPGSHPDPGPALTGVTTGIHRGKLTAIMGAASRTTLLRILSGMERPSAGRVYIARRELGSLPGDALARLRSTRLGIAPRNPKLESGATTGENVLSPLDSAENQPDPNWLNLVIGILGLDDELSLRPYELSEGAQRRVAIARAMITRPVVLFVEEPTAGLDAIESARVMTMLRQAVDEGAQTVVMTTDDPIAAAQSDRVLLLGRGSIRAELDHASSEAIAAALAGIPS